MRWFLVGLGVLAAGCTAAHPPCDQLNACPGALVCQVGRCVSAGAVPVAPGGARRVVEPSDARFVDAHEGEPPEIRAGSEAGGSSLLLLRFEVEGWSGVERAFLVLEPAEGALPSQGTVEIEVMPILEPWGGRSSALPLLGSPEARAALSFSPPRAARIDVTALIHRWSQRRDAFFGVAVRTYGKGDVGARFGWHELQGPGPRLDLYSAER